MYSKVSDKRTGPNKNTALVEKFVKKLNILVQNHWLKNTISYEYGQCAKEQNH